MQDAKTVTDAGHTWWKCPNCQQKLAEIIGDRVVIRSQDRLISLRSDVEQDQVCWRCGTTSLYAKQAPETRDGLVERRTG